MTTKVKKKTTARARPAKAAAKRSLFAEIAQGIDEVRQHREGKMSLRTHEVEAVNVPPLAGSEIKETREKLGMSQSVFAAKTGINKRTLERWENGSGAPRDASAVLLHLVRAYPDTIDRIAAMSASTKPRRAKSTM